MKKMRRKSRSKEKEERKGRTLNMRSFGHLSQGGRNFNKARAHSRMCLSVHACIQESSSYIEVGWMMNVKIRKKKNHWTLCEFFLFQHF